MIKTPEQHKGAMGACTENDRKHHDGNHTDFPLCFLSKKQNARLLPSGHFTLLSFNIQSLTGSPLCASS